ncbi:MAG: ParB/RepB/Spo0J family partition protein, partial [Leptospiraceae bacterium]|nr:ParB/RepB/Spo0J family partition protein [Leptospiraceae bacterium]
MSSKSKRLGGLADIFQTETLEGTIRKINISEIKPAEIQPRLERLKGVEELAKSLEAEGLLQPIVVTREGGNYIIIAGERRYHAAKSLGWRDIECKILNRNAKEVYRLAVIENLQRENLSPYEEIEALHILKSHHKYTDESLGNLFGKSRSYMSELLSISGLNKEELNSCKEAGIETKNLLIQAVKAAKNNNLHTFLEMIKKGSLNTVKQAKEFNKKKPLSTENSVHEKEEKSYVLKRTGDGLNLKVKDPEKLLNIYEALQRI